MYRFCSVYMQHKTNTDTHICSYIFREKVSVCIVSFNNSDINIMFWHDVAYCHREDVTFYLTSSFHI